ncbi:3-ketoacyl-ACP reductase [Bacillus sp. FJAT-27916]|uniref:glucose 1-dehydrogenase n=1 Tax=Bacillaceae TaxID=186817 RepID=UPI0006708209|nr:glucose 1-dehydrogenase [Bacillus sp. FJAT-27916]KMY44638.1 3-ketoacyl-ACP reductase [Bacillus sp. FJAT-27916]
MKLLENKVAIITGSGSGIGKEIATTYAQEGAKVVIADFNEEVMNATVKELIDAGYTAMGVKVNVSNEEDVQRMVEESIAKFGRIDILVNNAGVGDNMQAAANVEDDIWNRVMDINVTGVMRCIRRILPHFEENGGGTIVNMASLSGVMGGRGGLTYTAAKHAVVGMTKNVASHYGPLNIRANAIAPGHVETGFSAKMTNIDPFGMKQATRGVNMITKAGQVSDIANIALFLASDQSQLINGVVITADGGWSAY